MKMSEIGAIAGQSGMMMTVLPMTDRVIHYLCVLYTSENGEWGIHNEWDVKHVYIARNGKVREIPGLMEAVQYSY